MADEIGKEIAELLRKEPVGIPQHALALRREHLLNTLNIGVRAATTSINNELGKGVLQVVERSDGFQFNYLNELTLTVKVKADEVSLVPTRSNIENPANSTVSTWDNGGEFHFQFVPHNPTFVTPVLTKDEFIRGVMKMACKKHFDAK